MAFRSFDPTAKSFAREDLRAIRTLLPYLWPSGALELRARVAVALVCLVLAKVANVCVPLIFRDVVNALNEPVLDSADGSAETAAAIIAVPVALLIAYGVARVLSMAFGEIRDAVFAKVGQRAIRQVSLSTFRHLHWLALRFHLDRQTGGLSRSIERGTKGIEFLLTFMLFNVLPTIVEIFLVCGILWTLYGVWFAVVTFVTVASYIAYSLVVTEWRLKYRRRMNEMDSEANTKAIDSLLNYETVKYFGNETHEERRYDAALRQYEHAAVLSKSSLSLLNIGQAVIISAGLTIIMIMAGYRVANDEMLIGDFVAVHAFLFQLYLPLNFLGFVYREIKQSLADMESMFGLLQVKQEVRDVPGARPLELDRGSIEFDKVNFAYDLRRPILSDISFSVSAGRSLAIVGPSGAGKSTISRLLFRFYDVTGGAIRIDGQDLSEVTQDSLRASIGIVPQDTVLFNDTIYYNIAYGRPNATPAELERAAQLARIHDFIMALPEAYQTRVGERGLKLSGGERQRVAIARTILKEPRILLFDEATSALDTQTEKEIQRSLNEVSAGRTTLVIAHRLSTIVDADEIIVLESGRIVERGRHAQLLDRDGTYAAMWRRQQQAAELEEALGEMELAAT